MKNPSDYSVEQVLALSSDPILRRRFLLTDEDLRANLRFGLLLEVLDRLAEDVALPFVQRVHADARVVTAAVDNIQIRSTASSDRDVVLRGRINHVFSTSLEVGIRIEQVCARSVNHIASCYFTMVARLDGRNLALPPLTYAEGVERLRSDMAVARRRTYRDSRSSIESPPSDDEYALLARLHTAQDEVDFNGPRAAELTTSGWEETYPEHEYVPEKIFGGHVIHRAFVYATICAEAVAPKRPVVVSVNRINFHHPVRIGDKLQFISRVVYTGWSSIVVEVDIVRHSRDRTTTALCNTCIFTFVNVDEEMRPQRASAIYPSNYAEDARYLNAYRRHVEYKDLLAQSSA
jgi:acyl-CoA hydrolase